MKTQTLKFRSDTPIFIHTPIGIIRIEKLPQRNLRFTLPPFMTAFIGDKKDLQKVDLVEEVDGKIMPRFNMAAPVVNAAGELVGIDVPKRFVLEQEENHEHTNVQQVADGESTDNGR